LFVALLVCFMSFNLSGGGIGGGEDMEPLGEDETLYSRAADMDGMLFATVEIDPEAFKRNTVRGYVSASTCFAKRRDVLGIFTEYGYRVFPWNAISELSVSDEEMKAAYNEAIESRQEMEEQLATSTPSDNSVLGGLFGTEDSPGTPGFQ